jgi:hypothetical protein
MSAFNQPGEKFLNAAALSRESARVFTTTAAWRTYDCCVDDRMGRLGRLAGTSDRCRESRDWRQAGAVPHAGRDPHCCSRGHEREVVAKQCSGTSAIQTEQPGARAERGHLAGRSDVVLLDSDAAAGEGGEPSEPRWSGSRARSPPGCSCHHGHLVDGRFASTHRGPGFCKSGFDRGTGDD